MAQVTFDTLGQSKKLRQAEAITESQNEALAQFSQSRQLATKSDLDQMENRIIKSVNVSLFGFAGIIAGSITIAVTIAVAILK